MTKKKRIIILDTETTGINKKDLPHINHRIIEIGAVEIVQRRFTGNNFHVYIQPNRLVEAEASKIHGINNDFLSDKPIFKNIADNFLNYIKDSELVIHNADFDLGFINQEFTILNKNVKIEKICSVVDTLKIARESFPGKKNTLDALCVRYKINKSNRNLHSAIVDSYLLGKVYLLMTGGQESMFSKNIIYQKKNIEQLKKNIKKKKYPLKILFANQKETELHEQYLKYMKKKGLCLWN